MGAGTLRAQDSSNANQTHTGYKYTKLFLSHRVNSSIQAALNLEVTHETLDTRTFSRMKRNQIVQQTQTQTYTNKITKTLYLHIYKVPVNNSVLVGNRSIWTLTQTTFGQVFKDKLEASTTGDLRSAVQS